MADTINKYLTFTLDNDFFALDITSVREVQDVSEITRIPESPPYMKGVVNLRGNAVPVMDVKMKFGMEPTENSINTRIIILELNRDDDSERLVGALADSVKEVLEIGASEINPAPNMDTMVHPDYIMGIARKAGRFIVLLDLIKVFDANKLGIFGNDNVIESTAPETAP